MPQSAPAGPRQERRPAFSRHGRSGGSAVRTYVPAPQTDRQTRAPDDLRPLSSPLFPLARPLLPRSAAAILLSAQPLCRQVLLFFRQHRSPLFLLTLPQLQHLQVLLPSPQYRYQPVFPLPPVLLPLLPARWQSQSPEVLPVFPQLRDQQLLLFFPRIPLLLLPFPQSLSATVLRPLPQIRYLPVLPRSTPALLPQMLYPPHLQFLVPAPYPRVQFQQVSYLLPSLPSRSEQKKDLQAG